MKGWEDLQLGGSSAVVVLEPLRMAFGIEELHVELSGLLRPGRASLR